VRVLCLTPWFPDRPGEREGNYIFDSVTALADAGVEIKVMVVRPWKPWKPNHFEIKAFNPALAIELYHYASIPRNYWRSLGNQIQFSTIYSRLKRAVQRHRIELIQAHTEGLAEIATAVARELGIGCVVTIHGINTSPRYLGKESQRRYFRQALNRCDRVVLVGEPLRSFFAELCGRDDHFRVVHNGFRLTGITTENRIICDGRVTRLISVSNLHEGKGIDLTLRALTQLKAKGVDNWHYIIVGDGYERPKLERLVAEAEIESRVTFHGEVPHTEVARLLGQADLFVLPSYREAFGIAYLEAMACGLAAIGVVGQGAAEFIRHGENGLLVPPRSIDALAGTIHYALSSPDEVRRLAVAGQRTAQDEFNWATHAGSLVSLFHDVIVESRGS